MQWRNARTTKSGQGLLLAVILLLILGAIAWYLLSSRRNTEREAWAYAREVAEHVILHRFPLYRCQPLLSSAAGHSAFLRERIFTKLAELGPPNRDIKLPVRLPSAPDFFDARGNFRAEAVFPNGPARPLHYCGFAQSRAVADRGSGSDLGSALQVLRRFASPRNSFIRESFFSQHSFFIAGRWRRP